MNQWIKIPALIENIKGDDPQQLCTELRQSEIGMLFDFVKMWTKAVIELLDKLRDTVPAPGMLGEVHYWRDLCRVLDGISSELKQPQVEFTIQVCLAFCEKNPSEFVFKTDITNFTAQKSRVMKGAKEARWNNKYMKIIEQPVKQVEQATNLVEIQLVIIALLKSLNSIY